MTLDVWTTHAFHEPARYEAWRQALNRSHLEWDLSSAPEMPFGACIRQRTLDGISIVECRCDPCSGSRRRSQIGRSQGAYFGVLFELQGRESVRQGDNEAVLSAGDFILWDSEREMEFRVLEPLHKLTLLIPKQRLRVHLGDAERYAGRIISGSETAGGIAAEALRRIARDFTSIDEQEAVPVLDPILSLLGATLLARSPRGQVSVGHQDSFRRFCRYMEMNLGDSMMSPASVAAAHGVSLRYLHLVFAKQGTTLGRVLREMRLTRCYREMRQGRRDATLTEIAFRWGFNDMAHFSRVFKACYGLPPRAVIQAARRPV